MEKEIQLMMVWYIAKASAIAGQLCACGCCSCGNVRITPLGSLEILYHWLFIKRTLLILMDVA
jgi:hypothetical protein